MTYKSTLAVALCVACLSAACAGPSASEISDIQKIEAAQADLEPATFAENGVAIRGYDPVAYFTEGQPIQGSEDFTHEYQGAIWHFATAENRDAFAGDPKQYAPQYGGYCAWAVKEGYIAPIDPNAWKVVDGKLYLNFDQKIQARWEEDIPGHIAQGDLNWPKVLKK